jgi:2-oxoisovalerate dehydrogenase E1 component
MGDFTYRTREEVEDWRTRCPLKRVSEETVGRASEWGLSAEQCAKLQEEFEAIDTQVAEEIAEAARAAEAAPWPDGSSAIEHVYSEAPRRPVSSPPAPGDRQTNFVQATLEALEHEMERNPHIFVLGEGIGVRGGNFRTTAGLFQKFGGVRLCDTPFCERGFVGLACGAAMTGSRPVIDFMFVDFINDAYGELVNQIAKMQYMSSGRLKMPVLLRGCIGVGHAAATHHSSNFTSVYTHIPGLRVVIPSTPYDAKGLFLHALRSDDPVLFLECRELLAMKGPVPEEPYEIEFGKAAIARSGTAATVVAMGLMLHRTLEVAEALQTEGISIEVIDPRTASPLDIPTILESVAKTGRLLIVDEAYGPCSLASEMAAQVADAGFNDLDAPIKRLNGAFTPTPYSPSLEKAVVPQADQIKQAIFDLLAE